MVLFFAFFIWSCGPDVAVKDLDYLNGYWEIEKVVFPNQPEKTYGLSGTIDFFEVKDLTGYRKKLQPQIDGKYLTSDDAITIEITSKDNSFTILYNSGSGTWMEKLIAISKDELILASETGITYHYKRYQPLGTE